MLLIILIILILATFGGGTWGHPRYGYASWSPLGVVLVVLVILLLLGHIRL